MCVVQIAECIMQKDAMYILACAARLCHKLTESMIAKLLNREAQINVKTDGMSHMVEGADAGGAAHHR